MYCRRSLSGRNGKAASEAYRRLGQSGLHGQWDIGVVTRVYYSNIIKEYDLRNTASLEESVRHSDVVYNLVGREYPTK